MKLSKYTKMYDNIASNEDYLKKISTRTKWKLISLIIMSISTIILIITLFTSTIWIFMDTHRTNYLGMLSLFLYVISIILLVLVDSSDPLKKITKPEAKLYIYFYIVNNEFPDIDIEKNLFSFKTLIFYDLLNLIGREFKNNEINYNSVHFIKKVEFNQKLLTECRKLFLGKANNIFEKKEEFIEWLNLSLKIYFNYLTKNDDEAFNDDELIEILKLTIEINNFIKPKTSNENIDEQDKKQSKQLKLKILFSTKTIKLTAIIIIIFAAIYFSAEAKNIDEKSTEIAYFYTVLGTSISLILSIIAFPINKKNS
ncbi:hypothetical protein [Lysinibacillus sp. NPDC047702]|uniref:hypothetical protein n=1 Tax=unclassified Lysinibacillus TaxID=2636778 RepID=UPI003D06ABD2